MDLIAFEVECVRESLWLIGRDEMAFEDVSEFGKRMLFDLVADLIVKVVSKIDCCLEVSLFFWEVGAVSKIDCCLEVYLFFWEVGAWSRGACWIQEFLYQLCVFA